MNKVIDAGALIDALEHEEGRLLGLDKVIEVIDNQPSAIKDTSVEELVHCKDCKKRNTRTCMMNNNVGMNKDLFDEDYCSYGEKQVTSRLESAKVQLSQETPTNSKTETVGTSTCNLATNLQHDCKSVTLPIKPLTVTLAVNCMICDAPIPIYDHFVTPPVVICGECRKRLKDLLYKEQEDDRI